MTNSLLFAQTEGLKVLDSLAKVGNDKEVVGRSTNLLSGLNKRDSLFKEVLEYRVYSRMALSDYHAAVNDFQTLIELKPLNLNYYNGLAFAFWSLGNMKECIKYTKKAFEINSSDALTLSNLSYYYSETGKYEEGLRFASKGLELKGLDKTTNSWLLNNRGFAYIGLKHYDKALVDINESIKLNAQNSFAFYFRALANLGLGRMETVCDDLNESKKLGAINMTKELIDEYCEKSK